MQAGFYPVFQKGNYAFNYAELPWGCLPIRLGRRTRDHESGVALAIIAMEQEWCTLRELNPQPSDP